MQVSNYIRPSLRVALTLFFAIAIFLLSDIEAMARDIDILVGSHPLPEKSRHKREGYFLPLMETIDQFGMKAEVADDDVIIHKTCRGDMRISLKDRKFVLDDKTVDIGSPPIIRNRQIFYPSVFFRDVLGLDIHGGAEDNALYVSRVIDIAEISPDGVAIEYNYERSFTTFELDDGDTIRLVIDLDAAVIHSGVIEKRQIGGNFNNFRFAQFSNKPDIVRAVLELKKQNGLAPEYRINPRPNGLWIEIGPEPFKIAMNTAPDGCTALITGGRYSKLKENLVRRSGGGALTLEFAGARFPEKEQVLPGVGVVSRAKVTDDKGKVKVVFDIIGTPDYSIDELPDKQVRVSFHGSPGDLAGRVIVIDPGHGGRDPGAMRGSINEKDLNLEMSKFLSDELKALGATVYTTRNTDIYLSLDERLEYANRRGADLFVCVHTNATRQPTTELYGPMIIFDEQCDYRDLLNLTYEEMVKQGGREGVGPRLDDRGLFILRQRGNLRVLLIEAAFMNNSVDCSLLTQPEGGFKRNLMHGVATAILRYYTGNYTPSLSPRLEQLRIDSSLFALIDEPGLIDGGG